MKSNKNCTIVKRVSHFRKFFLSTPRTYTYKFRYVKIKYSSFTGSI